MGGGTGTGGRHVQSKRAKRLLNKKKKGKNSRQTKIEAWFETGSGKVRKGAGVRTAGKHRGGKVSERSLLQKEREQKCRGNKGGEACPLGVNARGE